MYKELKAEDFRNELGLPGDYAVSGMICYGSYDFEKNVGHLRKALDRLNVDYIVRNLTGFLGRIVEIMVDGKIYWFDVSYGGAMLSEFLHMACLFGSKKNILIGSCGGLKKGIEALDFVIPSCSYGNESATRMYDPLALDNLHFADYALSVAIKDKLSGACSVFCGKTMTCQAMLAESKDDILMWSKDGYLGVEMESSTVFAVSKHFNVPAAALLFVADNLIEEISVNSAEYKNQKLERERVRALQYEAALRELLGM